METVSLVFTVNLLAGKINLIQRHFVDTKGHSDNIEDIDKQGTTLETSEFISPHSIFLSTSKYETKY